MLGKLQSYWETPVVPPKDLILRADWAAAGITDEASFLAITEIEGITDFEIVDNLLLYNVLSGNENVLINGLNVEEVVRVDVLELSLLDLRHNQLTNFNPSGNFVNLSHLLLAYNQFASFNPSNEFSSLTYLDLRNNQFANFNPSGDFSNLIYLSLANNQLTTSAYTEMETFANTLSFISGNFYFKGNPDSVSGTNLEAILISKGRTVIA